MWRYMNVSNPKDDAAKRRKESDDQYEDKRIRSYRKEWERDHKWLKFDEIKGVMFCQTCRDAKMKGDVGKKQNMCFVTGATSTDCPPLKNMRKARIIKLAVIVLYNKFMPDHIMTSVIMWNL